MNLDSLSFTLSQISYLVASINKKTQKQVVADLNKLVGLHGLEADRHLVQCLFSSLDFSEVRISAPTTHNQVLVDYSSTLLNKPSLISSVCYITDNPLNNQKSLKVGPHFFQQLCKCLRLSAVQEVVFALALLHSSNQEVNSLARQHLRVCVPALVQFYIDTEGSGHQHEGGLHETTPEVLHLIFSAIQQSPKDVGLTTEVHSAFLNTLQRDFPKELVPVVLAPLVYSEQCELAPDMSSELTVPVLDIPLAELVSEIGYGFTSSVEECRNNLVKLNSRDVTPGNVARALAMMCQTVGEKGGGNNSWNVEVFVQALKEVVPKLTWNNVIVELDHPEFMIKDRQSLLLLISALRLGLQTSGFHPDTFPIDHLYRRWSNIEGQLSLITNILKNPDVFCFADYPCNSVLVDVLKTPPEQDSKELATWRSMNLVELLLNISECGLYTQVQDLFKFPMQNCPDVLVLSLLQIPGPVTILRQELLKALIPIFLGNHPNSAIILHNAWHTQTLNIKNIIMHSMAEWYARGDCDQMIARLSRILDVAQDLKALSMLLNLQSYPFIIDLACLASRREYLKLEKWLTDKVRDHGDTFVSACIKFLHRRCPQITGKMDELKPLALPNETLTTMVFCIQSCIHTCNTSQECQEAIMTMANNCTMMLKNRQPQPSSILRSHRGIDGSYNPTCIAGPIYPSSVESIPSIGSSIANMSLGGTNTGFNLQGGLGPLVQSPGSPSRILAGPSNSPFPIMPLQHQGPVGTGASLVGNSIGSLGRLGPNPGLDKPRIQEPNLFPEIAPNVSKDIEDEANSYFQRIYNHPPHPTLSIDEVLEMLKRFQESSIKREREVFNCMLRNLFEEYRFFPQYPDKELHITAQLFGGIIERGLVTSYMALGLALRFVLDALRKPEGSKMYYFGIAALDRFKTKLKDYHKYCEHVKAIPHFNDFPPHLKEYVEYGLQSLEPPSTPQGPVLPASLAAMLGPPVAAQVFKSTSATPTVSKVSTTSATNLGSRPSIANATNIDTLLVATEKEEKITSPPESLQDKIAFIFNNLSQINLQKKCDELRDIVSEEYWAWISQYLVMKRASIELNFHALYSNFLDVLKVPEVNRMVTKETFRNIKVLLRSDKVIANFSDRSLLKNLGHWLGMMTLGRNKPILQIDIDLKSLLIEAYHKGQQELLYIVPFIAKILESCAKSKVFKPPNPWTIAIMNVLAEMHQEPDLKLNLKFEIEVLCKTLDIEISQLKPSNILRDPQSYRKIEYQLQTQAGKKDISQTNSQINIPTNVLNEQELVSAVSTTTPPVAQNNSTTPTSAVAAPEPRFSYMDIQLAGNSAIQEHLTISPNIQLFQSYQHFKGLVKTSIERAVQEWIAPVADRSIKIALQTCEQIIRKDFALDSDESRMRSASHYMVRNLTAGMAMITCRDQLLASINSQLKLALQNGWIGATAQQREMIDQAAIVVAQDNMELACAFIQKTAIEKAIPEIDKRLLSEFELRKMSRQDGRRYYDPIAMNYQSERMPEQIRLKVGGVTAAQMTVYEEFARNIPGFLPLNERDSAMFLQKPTVNLEPPPPHPSASFQVPQAASDDLAALCEKLAIEVDQFIQGTNSQTGYTAFNNHMILLRDCLMIAMHNREMNSAAVIVQKCVEALQDSVSHSSETDPIIMKFREIIVRTLKSLQDPRAFGQQWINKNVTRFLTDFRDDVRYNEVAIETLIRAGLVNMPQFDVALAQHMENGPNYRALNLATVLVQNLVVDDRSSQSITETDFYNTIEMMYKINNLVRQPPEALTNTLDMLKQQHDFTAFLGDRASSGPIVHIHNGILQVRAPNYEDPPGLVEKTDFLIRDWINVYNAQPTGRDSTKAFSMFVHQMNLHGILKTDDLITRFFRLSTQLCVEAVYRNMGDQAVTGNHLRVKCFNTLDAFVRLVALLVKHSGDSNNSTTKIHLLNKVLGIVAGCLLQDHEQRAESFQQFPYHRIFIMLFLELNAPEPVLETINMHVLTAYCHTLHILRPSKAAGFCYAWLELVSHRVFMGRMLASTPQQKGWAMYAQLLIDLFKYLSPFLRNAELAKPVTMLYKGTLRVLLVLLHDFPEFLCDYHYGFCDVIPPNCIQMRNLILSAFPRNMRLPDPFTPNLKVDILQEIAYVPRVLTNYASMITPPSFKKDLDSYLNVRAPVTFLSELRSNLQISNEAGMRYNIPLMNALVLYVGTQAINFIRGKSLTPNMTTIAHSAHMDIFQNLAVDLDTEGRYLFLNSVANQLRYPNTHTHYFSCTLLYLFAEANTEAIQEQITRVLLERLIVNRPHPWGLLITFIELIKNPNYKFWNHEFVHCASEIEKLFESVARSCFVQKTAVQADGDLPE